MADFHEERIRPICSKMSSLSSWKNYHIEGLSFRNQPCNLCGRNAVIKISGSITNPRKAYFKCHDCNHFVMWLSEQHIMITKPFQFRNIEDEASSCEGISEEMLSLKKQILEVHSFMKFFVKLIALMFFVIVLVILIKF